MAGINFNFHYSEAILRRLAARLLELHERSGQKLTLIGHSRGGLLAKVLSHRHPRAVEQVLALGSPLRDPYDVHPLTLAGVAAARAYNRVRFGRIDALERQFLLDLAAPAVVPVTSLYTRSDGVVSWKACIRPDVSCVEVRGSHAGLAVNPDVYRVLAVRLSARPRAAA
jgi:pimeloyl-ACP methyl ester carboxylesterase